ncbi:MAG: zinc ribbon domain-containing protein [Bacilli bacterium]|nr:zinc ribbon domain-containing protein [Bacilli bacterium]MDD4808728.1 zinc ribbon domain-containing protein [Bacilli bacterium]
MICEYCQTKNNKTSKFCHECGKSLIKTNNQIEDIKPELITKKEIKPHPVVVYLKFILSFLLKPMTTLKKEINKFEDYKKTLILSSLIVLFTSFLTLLNIIISSIIKNNFNGTILDYLKTFNNNSVIYFAILILITLIYFLTSIVIKKEPHFFRLLGITTISVIPLVIGLLVFMPLSKMISIGLGMFIAIASIIYTLLILSETMSREFELSDSNLKIHFNLICLTLLMMSAIYAYLHIIN